MEEYLLETEDVLEKCEIGFDPDPLSSYHLIGHSKEDKWDEKNQKDREEEFVKYETFNIHTGVKRFSLPYKGTKVIFKIKSEKELIRMIRTACMFCMKKNNDLDPKNFNMRFYKGEHVCPLNITIDNFLNFDDCFIELDTKLYRLNQVDDL